MHNIHVQTDFDICWREENDNIYILLPIVFLACSSVFIEVLVPFLIYGKAMENANKLVILNA